MNTEDFQFFLRVAELGSISQAAKQANIAVSVASQRIQRLENQLSLRLFYRTTRKLRLTEEALILIEQGQPLLASFQALTENLKQQDQKLSGNINITASASFGVHVLVKVIADFLKLHPELSMNLDLNDQNVDLIAQGMDIAIRIGKLQDSSLIAKPLCINKRLLCAAPEYLQQFGTPHQIEDLALHLCIVQRHQKGVSHTWNFIHPEKSEQLLSVHVQGHFITNAGEGVRQAALSGLGISNHSYWHVQDDLNSGRLVQILPEFIVEPTAIYAVVPDRKLMPNKVKVLIEYLQDHFKNFNK
ncbi:LysR family transcriptional regulator [Acinetobacter sp.]|jgi:DNA-binding transcriptional LysR family regulator|uniref:LysR family transcriptional regulator n=1 Tax=Acinetobacter sp. TaxID=472 RepID=UPI00281A542A|nr:LysR family transcriptional regulator [Acinetobacter sp.]MDR0235071.1 LysR family transcriptional regulator [Acinetobacter sp.]